MSSVVIISNYNIAFDSNGVFHRENLTEAQAQAIVELGAGVGALVGGLGGGGIAGASIGATIGTNAVKENYLTAGQKDTMKREIKKCGKDWKCRNDTFDKWHNMDKNTNMAQKIGSDIVDAFKNAYYGLSSMESRINNIDNDRSRAVGTAIFIKTSGASSPLLMDINTGVSTIESEINQNSSGSK